MDYEIVTVQFGHPRYEDLVGPLRQDEELLATMWQDAESLLDEDAGKQWCIAVVNGVAAAWSCAILAEEGGRTYLKGCNNYEAPAYRGRGLYLAAYRHRHRTIISRSELPCLTYIFPGPLGLHIADGWRRTIDAWSDANDTPGRPHPSHHWYRLVRDPGRPPADVWP